MYLINLPRLELLANYGYYLGYELQGIRANLKAKATGASSEVQKAAQKLEPRRIWVKMADELIENEFKDINLDDHRT